MIEYSSDLSKILESLKKNETIQKVIKGLNTATAGVNYLDYHVTEKKVTFTGFQGKVQKWMEKTIYDENYVVRSTVKLASYLQKTAGLTENEARSAYELIVATIQATFDKNNVIKVVEGEEIRKSYLKRNYVKVDAGNNLASCMSGVAAQGRLDLYCFNPNIQLVVNLIDGKVAARSLLFKAFRSIEDAEAEKNPMRVMARVYAADTAARTRMEEWRRNNVDYFMDGSMVYTPASKVDNWGKSGKNDPVYVPLKFATLNGVPYLDNLRSTSKSGDTYFLTNKGYSASWPKKPVGGFPHPTNKDVVWSTRSKNWISKKGAVLFKGAWVSKASIGKCGTCELEVLKSAIVLYHKGGTVCKTFCKAKCVGRKAGEKKSIYALPSEVSTCKWCRKVQLGKPNSNKMCESCEKRYITCAIKSCGRVDSKRAGYQIEGQYICYNCYYFRRHYRPCSVCNEIIGTNVKVGGLVYCAKDKPPPVPKKKPTAKAAAATKLNTHKVSINL